jgi:mono/diheme cytochrome c family protein
MTLILARSFSARAFLALAAAVSLAAWSTGSYADNSGVAATTGIGEASGQEIYGRICQGCHMPNAQGAIGAGRYPKLGGDPALVSWQYAALRVLNGKGAMPGFGRLAAPMEFPAPVHLSDAQIADVVNYVRSHFGNRYKPDVKPEQIAALPHP